MSKRLDENLGTVDYDGLIVTNEPVADVFTVTIRKEATKATLKRGTVLAVVSGTADDGKMVALGTTAANNETLTANAILCDDTEIGTDADVEATAYRTGHFARNKLIFGGSGYALKPADEEALRAAGILLSDALDY